MARVRFVEIVAVTALVGALAACSSSASTGKSATGAPV